MAGERFEAVDVFGYPSPSSGRVDARSAAGWGSCRRQRRAAEKTHPAALPEDGEGEGLIPQARWFWAGCSPVTARGQTLRPTARRPWPRAWRRRSRWRASASRRWMCSISLPSSGRVDARSAAGWGCLPVTLPRKRPHPGPPRRRGGSKALIPPARWFWAGCSPVTASGRTPRPTARQPWPRPWRRRRQDGGRALRRGGLAQRSSLSIHWGKADNDGGKFVATEIGLTDCLPYPAFEEASAALSIH